MWTHDSAWEFCFAQGLVLEFSSTANIMWTLCFFVHLAILRRKKITRAGVRKAEKMYNAVVWPCSAGLTGVACGMDKIGHAFDGSCWVKESEWIYMGICRYFLLGLVCAAILAVVTITTIQQRRNSLPRKSLHGWLKPGLDKNRILVHRLLMFPLFSILLWAVSGATFVQQWTDPERPLFELLLGHAVLLPLQGALASAALALLVSGSNFFAKDKDRSGTRTPSTVEWVPMQRMGSSDEALSARQPPSPATALSGANGRGRTGGVV